jgi:hypothetical protein
MMRRRLLGGLLLMGLICLVAGLAWPASTASAARGTRSEMLVPVAGTVFTGSEYANVRGFVYVATDAQIGTTCTVNGAAVFALVGKGQTTGATYGGLGAQQFPPVPCSSRITVVIGGQIGRIGFPPVPCDVSLTLQFDPVTGVLTGAIAQVVQPNS